MKHYNLFKTSAPGWELRGAGIKMVINLFEEHTCKLCIENETDLTLKGYSEEWLNQLRGTSCGCEFVVEIEPDSFLDRLDIEYEDLADKVYKISEFLQTDKYKELTDWEKTLLNTQLDAMKSYESVLLTRITHYSKGE